MACGKAVLRHEKHANLGNLQCSGQQTGMNETVITRLGEGMMRFKIFGVTPLGIIAGTD